jgi:hypothetical protein
LLCPGCARRWLAAPADRGTGIQPPGLPLVCALLAVITSRGQGWPISLHASCCYHPSGQGSPIGPGLTQPRNRRLGAAAPQGLPPGSGKGPELALRTGGRLAGSEFGLRCLLGAQVPSQAPTPVQPVLRSSPSRRTGPEAAGCPSLRPGAVQGGQPAPGQPAPCRTVGRNLPRIRAMSTPKSLLYVRISTPDRRKSRQVITVRSRMPDRERRPSQWRWPPPQAPPARPRPRARAPGRPGTPRWPRR